MKKSILKYKDFLLEQNIAGSRTIEQAIQVAKTGKHDNQNFIDFLMTPFARRLTERPWVLVSTDRQLKSGTFMFKRINAVNPVSVGMFKTGYIRVVPDDPSRPSYPIITYADLAAMNLEDFVYKSSMDPTLLEDLNPYIFMMKHLENNFDMDAPAVEFPKFLRKKRNIKKGGNIFEILDVNGNVLAECPLSKESLPSINVIKERTLLSIQRLGIKEKEISGAFFSPDTFEFIGLQINDSKIDDSVINTERFGIDMHNSEMTNCIVNTGEGSGSIYKSLNVYLHNSEFKNVKISNDSGMTVNLTAEESVLDGSEIEIPEGKNTPYRIEIENCSVKGLKLPMIKTKKGSGMATISFRLDGVNISDSEDLSKMVIEMLNSGPPGTPVDPRFNNWISYDLKNCDFSGVDLSGFNGLNWDDVAAISDLASKNRNFDIDSLPRGISGRIKRMFRANDLFGED